MQSERQRSDIEELSWKERQWIYVTETKMDWHEPSIILHDRSEILEWVLKYFKEDFEELVYPSKSFSVAYIYACLIQAIFEPDKSKIEILSEPGLLAYNDPYFIPYNERTKYYYDPLIEQIGDNYLSTDQAQKTHRYFLKEMLIDRS